MQGVEKKKQYIYIYICIYIIETNWTEKRRRGERGRKRIRNGKEPWISFDLENEGGTANARR